MTIEFRFPTFVSALASGAPDWNEQVNELPNGAQKRILERSRPLRVWNVTFSTVDKAQHLELRNTKLALKGGFISCRWKAFDDYESDVEQDCSPATGTGALLVFQLRKSYAATSPATAYAANVTKPVQGTVVVEVNGVAKVEGANPSGDYAINYATGVVTFNTGKAPPNGHTVKASFEFDYVVRLADAGTVTVEVEDGEHSVFHHEGMEIEEVDS